MEVVFSTSNLDFNPRSHEGSDTGRGGAVRSLQISIRAPTRGATQIDRSIDVNLIFQSALPRGERRDEKYYMGVYEHISIRAPTRGATQKQLGQISPQ